MHRIFALLIALVAIHAAQAADPGPTGPLFRRNRQATPQATPPQQSPSKADAESAPPQVVGLTSEATGGAEVDTAEVIRRGDRVVAAGRGPTGAEERLIGDAMSPPPDDSHKWFFSIIVDDGKESAALLYDLKHSEHLRAWINLDEPKQSWSHATVYVAKDQTQDWRWAKLKITRYPVLILQPAAQLADESRPDSWVWGDPKTVVWQWDGYDATSPNRAQLRSDQIRRVLTKYVSTVAQRRSEAHLAGPRRAAASPPTPGARQAPGASQNDIGGPPPFTLPRLPDASGGAPVFPADPTFPSAPTSSPTGVTELIGALLEKAFGWKTTGVWMALLAVLKIVQMVAPLTKNKVDDTIAAYSSKIVGGQTQNDQLKT